MLKAGEFHLMLLDLVDCVLGQKAVILTQLRKGLVARPMRVPLVGFVVLYPFLWEKCRRITDNGRTLVSLTNAHPPMHPL